MMTRRLTRQQLRIAELVATGLTNYQIGKEMGISAGTVRSHTDESYDRLGFTQRHKRVQLAVWWATRETP